MISTSNVPSLVEPPINKPPTEILCKIFSDVLKLSLSLDGSYLGPHRKNSELLKLTAVCKRWRSAASECAILWTSIAFSIAVPSTIQCAKFFLGRSKEAMLSVHIWYSEHPRDPEIARSCEELIGLIAIQSHRISSCVLSSPFSDFWSHWSDPAPNLRQLVVQGYRVGILPIFRGQLPQLESLTSLHYAPWSLRDYTTLRQVDLRNHGRYVTLTSLLDTLRGCEMLEILTLHGYARLGHEPPHSATVSLPHLYKVNFFSSDSALILEHLETPSLAGPVIIFDSNPGHDILHPIPRIQRPAPYLEQIIKLHIILNSHSAQYYMSGYREDGTIALYIGVCGVGHWSRWAWVRASIEAIASSIHFFKIRNLTLSTDTTAIPWDLWLPNLYNLRDLTVSCPRSEGLLVSLLGSPSDDGLPLCPSLQSLALYRCGKCAVIDHASLMGFVISRYRAGRPLRKLKLHKDEWDWIQELDNSWVALVQSQCTYFGQRNV